MSDQEITCGDCGDVFVFTAAEQAFYAEKGLASPPKRCKACRQARKASAPQRGGDRGGQGQRGGFGGGGFSHGGVGGGRGGGGGRPRFSNDPNGYRSPMAMNDDRGGFGDRAPRDGGFRGGEGGGRPASNRFGGGGGRFDAPRGDRGPRGPRDGGFRGGPRGDRQGAASSEYRSPAFPDESRGGFGGGFGGREPSRGGQARDASHERATTKRPREEKPRFDITCVTCGASAQVPFKPLEGREVFCQPCYRARRGDARPGSGESRGAGVDAASDVGFESHETSDSDSGIVE